MLKQMFNHSLNLNLNLYLSLILTLNMILILIKGGVRGKIPTVDEVRRYCEDNGLTGVDPEDFYSHYERAEWKDRSGQPINNWRRVLETFDKNNRNYESGTGVCREGSKGDKAAGNLLPNQM